MGFGEVKKKKKKVAASSWSEVVGQLTVVENDSKGSPASLEHPKVG